jgi:AcrR family transcriptional regulator
MTSGTESAVGQESVTTEAEFTDWRRYTHDRTLPDVLDAALDLFVQYGYYGTTVRAIATKAALSVPGLYHHYRSKQEMLATLLRLSNHEIMRRAQAALADAGDEPVTRFVALVENIVLYMTHRRRLAHLAREIHCLEEPYRRQHIELRDELERMVLAEVTAAAKAGDFSTSDPPEATRAVLVLCRGVADWYTPGGPMRPHEIAQRYVRFALALVGGSTEALPEPVPAESGTRQS